MKLTEAMKKSGQWKLVGGEWVLTAALTEKTRLNIVEHATTFTELEGRSNDRPYKERDREFSSSRLPENRAESR